MSDTKEERAKQRRIKKDQKVFGNPVTQQNGLSFVSQSQVIKEPQASAKVEKKVGFFDKLVISPEMIGKRVFSFIITILALISTFLATYLACFGFPDRKSFFVLYYAMECMFAIDIALCFFTQYLDEENNKPVRDLKSIALRYIKAGFLFDSLATFPFHIVLLSRFNNDAIKDRVQLLFLLKMLRFRKMMGLFETKNFQDFIKSLFKTRLQQIIQNKNMNTN
jgi:hypothetical protein